MKNMKYCLVALLLCAMACGAIAGMDDVVKTFTLIGPKANTNSFVIRGEIESVRAWLVTPLAGVTGVVAMTSSDDVSIASLSVSNSLIAYPRIQSTDVSGVALGTATNNYIKIPIAGKCTVVLTQQGFATNVWKTKVVWKK